jgi:hypothetical protein
MFGYDLKVVIILRDATHNLQGICTFQKDNLYKTCIFGQMDMKPFCL